LMGPARRDWPRHQDGATTRAAERAVSIQKAAQVEAVQVGVCSERLEDRLPVELPDVQGPFRVPARPDARHEQPTSRGLVKGDAFRSQGYDIGVEGVAACREETGLARAQSLGDERDRQSEAPGIAAVEGCEVAVKRHGNPTDVDLGECRAAGWSALARSQEVLKVILGEPAFVPAPDPPNREQARVAPSPDGSFAHPEKPGGLLRVQQSTIQRYFERSPY